jgi:cytochrome oxidase assembly protein ShyY1
MKVAYPSKEEVGAWLTGMTVLASANVAAKGDFGRWWYAYLLTWLGMAALILIFLTIRATVRKRRDVAKQ